MQNIWFSSDFHYNHKNIVHGISEWEDKSQCRMFYSLYEHNETLIDNINSVVKPMDELWFLGDWSFGGFDSILEFRRRIKCQNIHLIFGNHDHHIQNNLHGIQIIFSSTQFKVVKKIGNKYMTLDHYSHRTWDKAHHGAWMLYGHSHGTLPEYGGTFHPFKTMDVGIDTHPEFRPYHFDEIAKIMSTRSNLLVDHHNSKTN